MNNLFNMSAKLFRKAKPTDTSAVITTSSFLLSNIKIEMGNNERTTTDGRTQSHSGILFFNIGISSSEVEPPLMVGDYITTNTEAVTLPASRLTVASVKEVYRKGKLHHLECELV